MADDKRYEILRDTIHEVLLHPMGREWTIQGLGMMRTKLNPTLRLHVWSTEARAPGVESSQIHDHPWDFMSMIMSGEIMDAAYIEHPGFDKRAHNYTAHTITCGPGGCSNSTQDTLLSRPLWTNYGPGDAYSKTKDEIHSTHPSDGAVSVIVRRQNEGADTARVFVPKGLEWVSAAPRVATPEEVKLYTKRALAGWAP